MVKAKYRKWIIHFITLLLVVSTSVGTTIWIYQNHATSIFCGKVKIHTELYPKITELLLIGEKDKFIEELMTRDLKPEILEHQKSWLQYYLVNTPTQFRANSNYKVIEALQNDWNNFGIKKMASAVRNLSDQCETEKSDFFETLLAKINSDNLTNLNLEQTKTTQEIQTWTHRLEDILVIAKQAEAQFQMDVSVLCRVRANFQKVTETDLFLKNHCRTPASQKLTKCKATESIKMKKLISDQEAHLKVNEEKFKLKWTQNRLAGVQCMGGNN